MPGQQTFNQCGVAKWSCVTAPGNAINSTTVQVVGGVPQPRYGSSSGTSMAGPHSAAALALIMQRFPYMTNEQALYTMFTTGRQNNTISDDRGSCRRRIPRAARSCRFPTGATAGTRVSLREAIKGPGQLLGPFDVDTQGYSDVWSNDISDVAIQARRQEDAAEAAAWEATKVAKGWTNGLPPDASDIDKSDFAIGTRREQARNARVYEGSLTKSGDGHPVPHRQRHLARHEHGRRRQALGRRLARERDRRRRRDARRQRHRRRRHRRRRRRAAARSLAGGGRDASPTCPSPRQRPERGRERAHRPRAAASP